MWNCDAIIIGSSLQDLRLGVLRSQVNPSFRDILAEGDRDFGKRRMPPREMPLPRQITARRTYSKTNSPTVNCNRKNPKFCGRFEEAMAAKGANSYCHANTRTDGLDFSSFILNSFFFDTCFLPPAHARKANLMRWFQTCCQIKTSYSLKCIFILIKLGEPRLLASFWLAG